MASVTQRKTPGVYVTEQDAFPPSIVGVETAVPAFIGYTEKAAMSNKSVFKTPVRISSMADYVQVFGVGFEGVYDLKPGTEDSYDVKFGGIPYLLKQTTDTKFYLYNSLRLYFDNGGGPCYIVSVGDYKSTVSYDDLKAGLDVIKDQVGPTILLSPDALLLDESKFGDFSKKLLEQCALLKDRMAILDIHGIEKAGDAPDPNKKLDELVEVFRNQVTEFLNYGAAYVPALSSTVVPLSEITYENFNIADATQLQLLQSSLDKEAEMLYPPGPRLDAVKKLIATIAPGLPADQASSLNKDLNASLPVLPAAYNIIALALGVLPPSGAMAGIYAFTDRTRGVWNAPANVSLTSVLRPTVKITSGQQEDLNVPVNGKAIDAIREFVGKGTVVWGARTLDGNSNDWRYIQVRRTILFIESSTKSALDSFVFQANDAKTWSAVVSMVSNFLQGVWNQGGLMGAKPSEAFTVQCGIGSTMTAQDVLEGYMVVQITLTMLRPAEFIVLTFKQQMLGA
jgi:phage tail sheath protein FI